MNSKVLKFLKAIFYVAISVAIFFVLGFFIQLHYIVLVNSIFSALLFSLLDFSIAAVGSNFIWIITNRILCKSFYIMGYHSMILLLFFIISTFIKRREYIFFGNSDLVNKEKFLFTNEIVLLSKSKLPIWTNNFDNLIKIKEIMPSKSITISTNGNWVDLLKQKINIFPTSLISNQSILLITNSEDIIFSFLEHLGQKNKVFILTSNSSISLKNAFFLKKGTISTLANANNSYFNTLDSKKSFSHSNYFNWAEIDTIFDCFSVNHSNYSTYWDIINEIAPLLRDKRYIAQIENRCLFTLECFSFFKKLMFMQVSKYSTNVSSITTGEILGNSFLQHFKTYLTMPEALFEEKCLFSTSDTVLDSLCSISGKVTQYSMDTKVLASLCNINTVYTRPFYSSFNTQDFSHWQQIVQSSPTPSYLVEYIFNFFKP